MCCTFLRRACWWAGELLEAAKKKLYAARLQRPTPYVDKTVYAGWNAMCVSAYLEAARVLDLAHVRHFALRSLDRLLSEGWSEERGMKHVIAYSDPKAEPRKGADAVPGVVDDYAFTVIACLDAYEATADLSYFRFARSIGDAMVRDSWIRWVADFLIRAPRVGRRTSEPHSAFWERGGSRFRIRRLRREIRRRRSRCSDCTFMRPMPRIASVPSRRWKSMPGWRDSTEFLRRRMGWRWRALCIRTRRSWSWGRMKWRGNVSVRGAATGVEPGGSTFGRG